MSRKRISFRQRAVEEKNYLAEQTMDARRVVAFLELVIEFRCGERYMKLSEERSDLDYPTAYAIICRDVLCDWLKLEKRAWWRFWR